MAGTIYSKFFWSDWLSDTGVRASSYAARGLWMDLLCIAAHEKGYVKINDRYPDTTEIAKITNGNTADVEVLLAELEANGVFSRDRNGHIYCRRMVKAEKNRKNGQLGGNPMLLGLQNNPFSLNQPPKPLIPLTTNHIPKKESKKDIGKHLLPDIWEPHASHFKHGEKKGLTTEEVNDAALEMRSWSLGNGEKRNKWDHVFTNWLTRKAERKVKSYGNGHGSKRNGPAAIRSAIYETLDRAIEATGGSELRPHEGKIIDGAGSAVRKSGPDPLSAWPSGSLVALPKAGD